MKLEIRKQNLKEMKEIYQGMMKRHFPPDERKPFWYIEENFKEGSYVGYGLYGDGYDPAILTEGDGDCLAYAWMRFMREEGWILLDYYAVTEKLRGQGNGSRFLKSVLQEVTQEYPLLLEVEDPDQLGDLDGEAAREERGKRLRRIHFYLKNGVKETELRARVFDVPYRIMVYEGSKQEKDLIQSDARASQNRWENLKKAYDSFYTHIADKIEIGS